VITFGRNYGSGTPIGEGNGETRHRAQPLYHWTPSIAPSGMAFYTGERFPALARQPLRRRPARPDAAAPAARRRAVSSIEERLLQEHHRPHPRRPRNGPDGFIYLLTDSPQGVVARLEPLP
jgi:glucose/arabinose dehydrogenase